MQPAAHYSACFYGGHDGWTTVARRDYADLDVQFKRPRSTDSAGNDYVVSRGAEVLGAHVDSYDDVISGAVIARRNERERNRVKTINQTFARLRQHLPSSAAIRYSAVSMLPQRWTWVHFSSPNPTQPNPSTYGPNPTKPTMLTQGPDQPIHDTPT